MSEGINVRLPGRLQAFVKEKSDPEKGSFSSASEYIRDLIRHDYEAEENRKWDSLRRELEPGMAADPSEFVEMDAADVIAEARRQRSRRNEA
jgi:antitoxin ParD1/3/4